MECEKKGEVDERGSVYMSGLNVGRAVAITRVEEVLEPVRECGTEDYLTSDSGWTRRIQRMQVRGGMSKSN